MEAIEFLLIRRNSEIDQFYLVHHGRIHAGPPLDFVTSNFVPVKQIFGQLISTHIVALNLSTSRNSENYYVLRIV